MANEPIFESVGGATDYIEVRLSYRSLEALA